jgi:hypothetical protein
MGSGFLSFAITTKLLKGFVFGTYIFMTFWNHCQESFLEFLTENYRSHDFKIVLRKKFPFVRDALKIQEYEGFKKWCPGTESNRRHKDFQSFALPTELPGLTL